MRKTNPGLYRGLVSALLACGLFASCGKITGSFLPSQRGAETYNKNTADAAPSDADGNAETMESSSSEPAVSENGAETLAADVGGSAESEAGTTAADIIIQNEDSAPYAYRSLSDREQVIYNEVLAGIRNRREQTVSTLDQAELNRIYNYVLADHPEIFYVDGYTVYETKVNDVATKLSFESRYTMSAAEAVQYTAEARDAADQILAGIPAGADDYTKAKYIYDWIVKNTEYQEEVAQNQTILSVLLNHQSVCAGYAHTFQYLMEKAGLETIYVTGTAQGADHAWNISWLDGVPYQFDVTWGEVSTGNSNVGISDYIRYDYFAITSEEMLRDHVVSDANAANVPLPDCTETADNYFHREGTYLSADDVHPIGDAFQKAYRDGAKVVQLKFANRELFERMMHELVTGQAVYSFIRGGSSVSYIVNDAQYTVAFSIG
ncbi:transglutaminase domain-containing protein [Oribacterium sp. HCP28S3_H8]|uniref:transglutaminase domain-containing protein n=1 Tax=Oribacterium sp. HCP28S3_H8 TaxID=3438945 RepID=UPI003F8B4465